MAMTMEKFQQVAKLSLWSGAIAAAIVFVVSIWAALAHNWVLAGVLWISLISTKISWSGLSRMLNDIQGITGEASTKEEKDG